MEVTGRRKLGDRRNRPRYDIVGDLWGTMETVVLVPLMNIARGGVLVESRVPLPANSVHRLTLAWNGENVAAEVCVRHVHPSTTEQGEKCFLIGFEFVSVQPALMEQIAQMMALGGAATT